MTANAKNTFGSELWVAADGGTLVKVADLLEVKPPALSRGVEDATTHDSVGGWSEHIDQGVIDTGAIAFTGHWIPGSAGDILLRDFLVAGTLIDFEIVKKGTSATGKVKTAASGHLTGYDPQALPVRGKQVFNGEIMPTGVLTQTPIAA